MPAPKQTERYTWDPQDYRDELAELRTNLKTRMRVCTSAQSYALLGRLLFDVAVALDALDHADAKGAERDPALDTFMAKLAAKSAKVG